MLDTPTKFDLKQRIADEMQHNPTQNLTHLADELGLSEGEVTLALPKAMLTHCDGSQTESLLATLPLWGKVTTIIHSEQSIFEFKAPFPKGRLAHGYYNLMGKEGFHGHLKIDLVAHIAFVSKPFMNMESHYIGFYTSKGNCVFKVYLGRDKQRQLFPEQVAAFNALKQEFM